MAKPNLGTKDVLNPIEAVEYWNLSRRKFLDFLKTKEARKSDFIAFYGERKLIIRDAFDTYLLTHPEWKEEYTNGISNKEIHEKRLKASNPA